MLTVQHQSHQTLGSCPVNLRRFPHTLVHLKLSSLHCSLLQARESQLQSPTDHKRSLGRLPKPGSPQLWAAVSPLPTSHPLNSVKVWYCAQLKSGGAWSLLNTIWDHLEWPSGPSPGQPETQRRPVGRGGGGSGMAEGLSSGKMKSGIALFQIRT